MIAFFETTQSLPQSSVPHFVSILNKTDKCDSPENRPENRAQAGSWKTNFHLDMSFLEVSNEVDFLVGCTSDELTGNIRTHITIFKNTDKKFFTVLWIIVSLSINVLWKSKVDPAGLQNNFIKVTDAGIPAPVMYLMEINFICMFFEIKSKITQQTDTETTV